MTLFFVQHLSNILHLVSDFLNLLTVTYLFQVTQRILSNLHWYFYRMREILSPQLSVMSEYKKMPLASTCHEMSLSPHKCRCLENFYIDLEVKNKSKVSRGLYSYRQRYST